MMTPQLEADLKACLHVGPKGTVASDGRDIPGFEHAITLITSLEIRDWTLSAYIGHRDQPSRASGSRSRS